MKKFNGLFPVFLIFGIISAIFFSGCQTKCTQTRKYVLLLPVYKSIADIRNSFEIQGPKNLENPGKIHVLGNMLFIVDKGRGVHVVDNSDINSPVFKKFIKMDACTDITTENGYLYANQGPDIVTLNISNLENITFENRLLQVAFSDMVKADSFQVDVIEQEVIEVIEDAECNGNGWGRNFGSFDALSSSTSGGSGGTGTSGSMARLAIIDGFLYVVDQNNIATFSLLSPNKPNFHMRQNAGNGLETIYSHGDYIFIGTNVGMQIHKVNGGNFQFVSNFSHARGCDPVVVDGNLAYVTLRGNDVCGEAPSVLSIINIENINNPKLITSYPMNDPHGLGIDNNVLAICDGSAGLKLFDVTKTTNLTSNQFAAETGMKAYDIIMMNGHAILTSEEGIFQYDLSNPSTPKRVSALFAK